MLLKRLLISTLPLAIFFAGCSREDPIKENPTLGKNHAAVFAFQGSVPDSAKIAELAEAVAEQDTLNDTLTITVHDSLRFMGILPYNTDKIYKYLWKMGDSDSLLPGANKVIRSYAYDSTGTYTPMFIAIDGASARDSARNVVIHVINTPPVLTIPMDTVRARSKKAATLKFLAHDSCGSIVKTALKYANKDTVPYTVVKDSALGDTIQMTIPYNDGRINTNNDEKLYISVTDDDANTVTDSVIVHFNFVPQIQLLQPDSSGRADKNAQRLALYYKGTDADGAGEKLRYDIRMARSDVFTDGNLVAQNIKEQSWEAISDSAVWNISKDFADHNIYWQVRVMDGYDTTYSSTWKFFLGDPGETQGTFYGYAKFQGRTVHDGIRLVFKDSLGNQYLTHTGTAGLFSIKVNPGKYAVLAQDTTGYGFKWTTLTGKSIEMGEKVWLDTLILKDSVAPKITANTVADTLASRALSLSGTLSDSGSQVASGKAWLDGNEISLSTLKTTAWTVNLTNLTDGAHKYKMTVTDSVGNVSDTLRLNFVIKACSISLLVNGKSSDMADQSAVLSFSASVTGADPTQDTLTWTWPDGTEIQTKKVAITSTGATLLSLNYSDFKNLKAGTFYTMTAAVKNGSSASVRFGFMGNDPVVYFSAPASGTVLTMNDTLRFTAETVLPSSITVADLSWETTPTLIGNAPASGTTSAILAWKDTGKKSVIVKVTASNGNTAADTMNVNVISDPPTVSFAVQDTIRQKINSRLSYLVSASDKYGTVDSLYWTCTNGSVLNYDSSRALSPAKSVTSTIGVVLPGEESDSYKCIVKAVDDDGESSTDTLHFRVVLDKPTITITPKVATKKINASVQVSATATDTLGSIVKYELACDSVLKNASWVTISKPDTAIKMPSKACTWKCMMRVTDDDGLTAADTSTYTVLLDPPSVQMSQDTFTTIAGDTLILDAIANDVLGSIVKYEWSCGASGIAGKTFVQTSMISPRYTAVMPGLAQNNYQCIIRVTDDDGLTAMDTTRITILSNDPPLITATPAQIYVIAGDGFTVSATQAGTWRYPPEKFRWTCGDSTTPWLEYESGFTISMPGSLTKGAAGFTCAIEAVEKTTGLQAKDSLEVNILTAKPVGVITAPDTTYVWSGDETVPAEGKYYYTSAVNGASSTIGTLGNKSMQEFWWNFSSTPSAWYGGNVNGSLDTNYAEFNAAFVRDSLEGSVTIKLDYRDSTTGSTDATFLSGFYYRHRAETVSHTVYFRKAWLNVSGGDTVIAQGSTSAAPAFIYHNSKLTVAYLDASGNIVTAYQNGSSWKTFGSAITNALGSFQFASGSDGTTLYLSYIDADSVGHVLKSLNGTSSWTTLGNTFGSSVSDLRMQVNPANGYPTVLYLSNATAYFRDWNGSAWGTQNTLASSILSADVAFDASGNRTFAAVNTSYALTTYYYKSGSTSVTKTKSISSAANGAARIVYAGEQFYLAFADRGNYGYPTISSAATATVAANGSWTQLGTIGRAGFNISIAAGSDGYPVIAFGDNYYARNSQVHVYRYSGSKWKLLGENELPYFKNIFYKQHSYYIRGSSPILAVTSDGSIYLSMLAIDTRSAGSVNNGAIVMKYRGETW
jgi:hypothetical protein